MKRKDINVGDILYFDSSPDWKKYGFGKAVEVVDEGAWSHSDSWSSHINEYDLSNGEHVRLNNIYPSKGSSGVLVKLDPGKGGDRYEVVQLSALRGKFEEAKGESEKVVAANREMRAKSEAEYAASRIQVRRAIDTLAALGIAAYGWSKLEINGKDLDKLMELLDQVKS